jgi:hypothetical protein
LKNDEKTNSYKCVYYPSRMETFKEKLNWIILQHTILSLLLSQNLKMSSNLFIEGVDEFEN